MLGRGYHQGDRRRFRLRTEEFWLAEVYADLKVPDLTCKTLHTSGKGCDSERLMVKISEDGG